MSLCPNCGANLLPGAATCIFCEHQTPAEHQAAPLPPAFSPPPAAPAPSFRAPEPPPRPAPDQPPFAPRQVYAAPPVYAGWRPPQPPAGPAPNFVGWFLAGLLGFFICQASVPGLIGGIIAFTAKSEWDQGRYDVATKRLGTAKALIIVGYVLAAMFVLLYLLLMLVGAISGS